jgi:hypothetical protein
MNIICLKQRRYDGTITIIQMPLTSGMQDAKVAIAKKQGYISHWTCSIKRVHFTMHFYLPSPINGILKLKITEMMQKVIGT